MINKLNRMLLLNEKRKELKLQLEEARSAAIYISPVVENVKIQKSFNPGRYENNIIKLMEIENKYLDLENEYLKLFKEVLEIENLTYRERSLVLHRYINGLTWENVSRKLELSDKQLYRINNKIKEKL